MKKWYTVKFSAKMSEDDVRAMNKCFYDAMEEAMQISPCADLTIQLDNNQNNVVETNITPDIILEKEDLLYFNKNTNNIIVDKDIFDCFEENSCINICFVDDKGKHIMQYKMIFEDEEGIYMMCLDEFVSNK